MSKVDITNLDPLAIALISRSIIYRYVEEDQAPEKNAPILHEGFIIGFNVAMMMTEGKMPELLESANEHSKIVKEES